MGLDIHGKKSDLGCHFNYSGIHFVRWLAVLICGAPHRFGNEDSNYTTFHWETSGCPSIMKPFELPTQDQLTNWNWALKCTGYYFPNLMFHSDAKGSYTPRGKVFKKEGLLSGNSKGLLKELNLIEEEMTDKIKCQNPRGYEIFKTLHTLVKDEVENGDAVLEFC